MDTDTTRPQAPTKSKKSRRMIVKIGAALLLLAISVGAIIWLINYITQTTVTPIKSDRHTYTAKEMTDAYAAKGAEIGLSDDTYTRTSLSGATISYKLDGKEYRVATETNNALLYAPKTATTDDRTTVFNRTTDLLTRYGYETTTPTDTTNKGLTSHVYKNSQAICELMSLRDQAEGSTIASHQFSCVDITAVKKEYADIDTLLTLYRKQHAITPETVKRDTESDGGVGYAILYTTQGTTNNSLLFGRVNDQWEYIGDLAAGDKQYATTKYTITPETKQRMSDPKYNGFLVKQLIGQTS